jgi:hypothetical protein
MLTVVIRWDEKAFTLIEELARSFSVNECNRDLSPTKRRLSLGSPASSEKKAKQPLIQH